MREHDNVLTRRSKRFRPPPSGLPRAYLPTAVEAVDMAKDLAK